MLGLGMRLTGGAMVPVLLANVPVSVAAAVSGLFKTVQEFGGAMGVAATSKSSGSETVDKFDHVGFSLCW